MDLEIVVNGRRMSGSAEGRTLLSSFLRDELGLTG
ncbi:MAG: (2Fe-2S)-binding protein, partial [Arenibacterium sp.]